MNEQPVEPIEIEEEEPEAQEQEILSIIDQLEARHAMENIAVDLKQSVIDAVAAKVIEDFTTLSAEQLELAPKIKFDSKEFNFGTVKLGDVVEHSFFFTNLGKQELNIRNVTPNAGCSVKSKGKSILKNGEKSQIDIVVNTRGRTGKLHKTITVISNDPQQPSIILNIVGTLMSE